MTCSAHKQKQSTPRHATGVTLVELLVSLVVFGALMAGVAQLVATNSRNANATGTLARIEDTGRTAIQVLSADIRRAGYFGGNMMNSTNTDFDMVLGTLGDAPVAIACNPGTNDWARMIGQPIVGIDEDDNVLATYECLDHEVGGYERGDVLTVRYGRAVAAAGAVSALTPNRPYLRTTPVVGKLFLGADTGDVANQIDDLTARVYELAAHTYYVALTDRECDGNPIPALFRTVVDDNGLPVSEELLAGVENMQLRYLVGNQYFDAADVPNWLAVQAVETTVLARAECPEAGFRNNREFILGDESFTPTDSFRRQLFSATTQLRN